MAPPKRAVRESLRFKKSKGRVTDIVLNHLRPTVASQPEPIGRSPRSAFGREVPNYEELQTQLERGYEYIRRTEVWDALESSNESTGDRPLVQGGYRDSAYALAIPETHTVKTTWLSRKLRSLVAWLESR